MVDLVRCKLIAPYAAANNGKAEQLSLSAVYEGSPELQKLSENAVFGDASPSAYIVLTCEEQELLGWFQSEEEYYLDTVRASGVFSRGTDRNTLKLRMRATFVYQNPNFQGQLQVTMAVIEPSSVTGNFNLTVHNKAVFDFYEQGAEYDVVIRVAKGSVRRSDEEIAIREKMLETFRTNTDYATRYPEAFAREEKKYIRNLARARGEPV